MSSATASVPVLELSPPTWVTALVGGDGDSLAKVDGISLCGKLGTKFSLVSARITNARALKRDELGGKVHRCYAMIADVLKDATAAHPVRFWNHICRIHEPMGAGLDRYMAFNAGRFRAFAEWYGGEANFDRCIATATGVGCGDDDVVIHVLAARQRGVAVANPRQVQSFRYSQRFGPRPPCFARATVVPRMDGETMVLIGGTASIRGEESMFVGDLAGQLEETFENLRALMGQAGGTLADVRDLRIYAVDLKDEGAILAATKQAMPGASCVELLPADLCRKELVVEIEGCAILPNSACTARRT